MITRRRLQSSANERNDASAAAAAAVVVAASSDPPSTRRRRIGDREWFAPRRARRLLPHLSSVRPSSAEQRTHEPSHELLSRLTTVLPLALSFRVMSHAQSVPIGTPSCKLGYQHCRVDRGQYFSWMGHK